MLSPSILQRVKDGYLTDAFCKQMLDNVSSTPGVELIEGVLYFENRMVIPADAPLREEILHDAHDVLGHLGARKTYLALTPTFYWNGMSRTVKTYVRSCDSCQRFKARTTKLPGELHSLPIPSRAFEDVALDFVGPFPTSGGFDMLLTVTCRLTGYTRLIPSMASDTAAAAADRLFEGWYRLFGLPARLVSDRDKLFVGKFWRALHQRLGVRLQMSTSFHPQTDGRSERTNKTAIQILRGLTSRNQKDWVSHLPAVEFAMNVAVNDATGKTPFEMVLGFTPSLAPPTITASAVPAVEELLADREATLQEARDAMVETKVRQAQQANAHRGEEPEWKVGDLVMIDSRDRRLRYKSRSGTRAAKLFPRHDGPYKITQVNPAESRYKLKLDDDDKSFNTFHVSKLKAYVPNDPALFPSREPPRTPAVIIGGEEEFRVEGILDERKKGRGMQYLIKWEGWPESEATWEPRRGLVDTSALDVWEARAQE
jgi:transposase InsO family protein